MFDRAGSRTRDVIFSSGGLREALLQGIFLVVSLALIGYIIVTRESVGQGNLILFIIPLASVVIMALYSLFMIYRAMVRSMMVVVDRRDKTVAVFLLRWNRVRTANRLPLGELSRVRVLGPSRKKKRDRVKAGLDPNRWYVVLETRAGGSVGVINTNTERKAQDVGKKLSQALRAPLFVR